MTLFYLRAICLVLWGAAAVALVPSAIRHARRIGSAADAYRTGFFFTALLFVGSLGRWLFLPDAEDLFVCLYVLTGLLAVYVLILAYQGRQR